MATTVTGVDAAVKAVGSVSELARRLQCSRALIAYWRANRIPAERVPVVSLVTGVPMIQLRPDLYRPVRGQLKPRLVASG